MSREIKYRLIRNGKIVGYERHRLSYVGADKTIIIVIEHSPDGVGFCDFFRRDVKWAWISHDTKEQYIGLNDKKRTEEFQDGQPVCQDDIVKSIWQVDHKTVITGRVTYYSTFALWSLMNSKGDMLSPCWTDCEVIGDIHANPELVESN